MSADGLNMTERSPTDRGPTDRGPTDRSPTDRGPTDHGPTERSPTDREQTVTRWLRQLRVVVAIEFRKVMFSRRSLPVHVLTLMPIMLLLVIALLDHLGEPVAHNVANAQQFFSRIYAGFILGSVVFFGSAVIFTSLFRGEILDRSLHYYLLAPVRREILAIGKYLAGLVAAVGLFGTTTIVCYLLLYLPYGSAHLIADMSGGVGLDQMTAYLGVTVLGCLGYGALFMLFGIAFRNPVVAVAILLGWEVLHFVLPPALKALSIIHYLKGLLPIPLDEGPLAIIIEPPPAWVSIWALVALAAVGLAGAVFFLRRSEVMYAQD
jgi:ABC-type transport system involved in multi-copper enzyme maturation permease subunit|tara:strand:- start:2723 stop:3685 length:963 start_codon:yes stop_codon:yes gene_type:complete